jgi:hypothetical protein
MITLRDLIQLAQLIVSILILLGVFEILKKG